MIQKKINGLRRTWARLIHYRPSSHPYISGDTFRAIAHHTHEVGADVTPKLVQKNDIVFVEGARLTDFLTAVHPRITAPYILISHNGDQNITADYFSYLTDTIIHWFAQNVQVSHPKITPLPIGLENKWYYLHGIPNYFKTLRREQITKKFCILHKFNVNTNRTEREDALAILTQHPLAITYNDWRESYTYLRTLQQHAFVASPPGNGEDCIRTWESMYLGTVPIVKRSALADYFYTLGLPLVVIDSWSELLSLDEERLREIYATMSDKWDSPALWADFWINEIKSKKV